MFERRGAGGIGARVTTLVVFALLLMFVGPPTAGADPPPATDVLLIFDTTGSMTDALAAARDEVESAMQQIDGELPNVDFGVAQVRDYADLYGEPGDTPWQLDQPITGDRVSVLNAINALQAGGGGTVPESYARALAEAHSNSSVGWRADAQHVVLLVGDTYPHDADLDEGIAQSDWIVGAPWDTGADPGPDEIVGTSDDVDWQSVLRQMDADDMPLMFLFNNATAALSPYWNAWTAITGGLMETAGSGKLSSDLAYLVERGAGLPPCVDGDSTPPCAVVPADETKNWHGGRARVHLDRAGAPRLPFRVQVDGALAAAGQVLKVTGVQLATTADRTLEITGPGVAPATYALSTGGFAGAEGAVSSPASLALTLAWPATVTTDPLSVPLFTLSSQSDYKRTFAHLHVDASVAGSLETSVGAIAGWVRAHGWLGPAGQASVLAWWLSQHAGRVPATYGQPLEFEELRAPMRAFLARSRELAAGLGVQARRGAGAAVGPTRRGPRDSMPRWRSRVAAQPVPAGVDSAGLRSGLSVSLPGLSGLRHGSWRRPGR